ncbi:Inner membrane protein YqaA [bacterium HR40]|nr:Inner membrane protein YqaA [bacterium HR40]
MTALVVFLVAFGAATLLPLSSEAVLVALIAADGTQAGLLLAVATFGNTLGALVNWTIGWLFGHLRGHPRFPVDDRSLERAERWFARFGVWSLLFAWLPVVGDPLTVLAGLLRTPLRLFLPLVALGKFARYAAIVWFAAP